jgi:outer membrane lipoprotein SlyB
MKRLILTTMILVSSLSLTGCATGGYGGYGGHGGFGNYQHRNAVGGALIGGAGGALLGGAVSHSGQGALVGGAVGAAVGGLVGHSMDRKREERQSYRWDNDRYNRGYNNSYYGNRY